MKPHTFIMGVGVFAASGIDFDVDRFLKSSRMKRVSTALWGLLLPGLPWRPLAVQAEDPPRPLDLAKRAEQHKALKRGMFVCWSFSTFSGREWTPGVKVVSFFRAKGVDTDQCQWARTAREAGMGYIFGMLPQKMACAFPVNPRCHFPASPRLR